MNDPRVEQQVQDEGPGSNELVTIRKFQELLDASLAKSALESADIESFIKDEYTIGHVVQVCLQVARADVEAADSILEQPIPESFEVEGVGSFQQPRCPMCGSLDVSFEGWQSMRDTRGVAEPVEARQDAWRCQACKHVWPATGGEV